MTKTSNSLNNINENINFYIQKTKNIPILSKDEEYILAKNFKEKNDIQAARQLIESNINYVIKIAKNYNGYGIAIKDLIQEGLIGLMKAIKKFDPEQKNRLMSFAIYWIKSEIHEYIIKNLRIVKIASTKNQKKLFFNLKKIKKIGWLNNKEKDSIANLLNSKNKEIEYIESRFNNKDLITNFKEKNENDDNNFDYNSNSIQEIEKTNPLVIIEKKNWDDFIKKKLNKALYKLDDRSLDIIKKRWLLNETKTLKKLAQNYNISSERVRQIETTAMKKLRKLIESDV